MINPQHLVLTACQFHRPVRIPRFDGFWEFPPGWQQRFGSPDDLTDISIWVPDEGTFPTRAKVLREDDEMKVEVDSWGRTIRQRKGAYFSETLEVPLPPGVVIDTVQFDAPGLDNRYLMGEPDLNQAGIKLRAARKRHCVFGKTGGPFLRSTFVRGETQFLMDIAADTGLAKAIADKVADHLTGVGLEELHRWSLQETGMWIYDDMASNQGPLFSPRSFESIFLPAYRRMIKAYKDAGARYVFLHSDGDIRLLLDMLIDAGIDGINPIERRAGMNMMDLRKRYPHLILTGGMDNTGTLINGPITKIQAEAREIIDLGRDGGVVIGTHSISPEIPMQHFAAYHEFVMAYGNFSV